MSTRILSPSHKYAWVDGKAYKVKNRDPLALSPRSSPSWQIEDFAYGRLWPQSPDELFMLVDTLFPGLTLYHPSGRAYRKGSNYLVVERRDAFRGMNPYVYDCLEHGYARTSEGYFFGFKFRDGGKWSHLSTIQRQPLHTHDALVPMEWMPQLAKTWGLKEEDWKHLQHLQGVQFA